MSSGKPFPRGRPQPARHPPQYQDDREDEPDSGDTHYFYKANGFTINGGEFSNVRGNVNHYSNDLRGSTNYNGQSANNSRSFGTGATFNGGDFTHANGDSNYYGPSNNYSGKSSHRDYRGSTNYDRWKDREEEGMNNRRDLRNPSYRGYEPSPHDNRLRTGGGPHPPPKEEDEDAYGDPRRTQRQDYYARNYDRVDEEGWDSAPRAKEDYNQRGAPPSSRERGNFRPQQISRNSRPRPREDYQREQNAPLAQASPRPADNRDSEVEVSRGAQRQITDALVRCLSFDSHSSRDQQAAQEQVVTALQQYFETQDMDEYDDLVQALSQYQDSHKDVGQPQLRERLFKALRRYLHTGHERNWEGFLGAVSDWEALYSTTKDRVAEEEEQGRSDEDDDGQKQT